MAWTVELMVMLLIKTGNEGGRKMHLKNANGSQALWNREGKNRK